MKTTVQINIKPKLARALEKVPEAAIEKWLQDCFPNTLEADAKKEVSPSVKKLLTYSRNQKPVDVTALVRNSRNEH